MPWYVKAKIKGKPNIFNVKTCLFIYAISILRLEVSKQWIILELYINMKSGSSVIRYKYWFDVKRTKRCAKRYNELVVIHRPNFLFDLKPSGLHITLDFVIVSYVNVPFVQLKDVVFSLQCEKDTPLSQYEFVFLRWYYPVLINITNGVINSFLIHIF